MVIGYHSCSYTHGHLHNVTLRSKRSNSSTVRKPTKRSPTIPSAQHPPPIARLPDSASAKRSRRRWDRWSNLDRFWTGVEDRTDDVDGVFRMSILEFLCGEETNATRPARLLKKRDNEKTKTHRRSLAHVWRDGVPQTPSWGLYFQIHGIYTRTDTSHGTGWPTLSVKEHRLPRVHAIHFHVSKSEGII